MALLIDRILAPGGLSTWLQPIWRDRDETFMPYAAEVLTRGPRDGLFEAPDVLFEYARRRQQEDLADRRILRDSLPAAAAALPGERISINVHASTLGRDAGFANFVFQCTARACFPPERLILEVLEHSPSVDATQFRRSLDDLRERGVTIALDDFGAGLSNMRQLVEWRPDLLKLDRALIQGIDRYPTNQLMLEAMQSATDKLGIELVAEGIEAPQELETLRQIGIPLFQGYLLGSPRPLEEVRADGIPTPKPLTSRPSLSYSVGQVPVRSN